MSGRSAATIAIAVLAAACGSGDSPSPQDPLPPKSCDYPGGPYGVDAGDVLAPSYGWEGFVAYATQPSTVAITDFFDCDGAKDIHASLFVTVAYSCDECRPYLMDLDDRMSSWEVEGIRIVILVGNGAAGGATVDDAAQWKNMFDLQALAVVADPNFSFLLTPEDGIPVGTIVDPRTMLVVARYIGIQTEHATLEELARDNAGG